MHEDKYSQSMKSMKSNNIVDESDQLNKLNFNQVEKDSSI